MKTIKTYEILKMIDESADRALGRKFELISGSVGAIKDKDIDVFPVGAIATVKPRGYEIFKSNDVCVGIEGDEQTALRFNGFEEWREIEEPVTWQEAIQAWINGKGFRIEYGEACYRQSFKNRLGCITNCEYSGCVNWEGFDKAILLEGKIYIED